MTPHALRYLNLGIVAHIDAGKTSLTERLLYEAGVLSELGTVDSGSTHTDSMALERERGITIRAGVVAFGIGDTVINLIDTPGHPDFIAEVERALSVLDGAVLVVSAVEGVQPQTRILMRAMKRLRLPTVIFVNKIDRVGARADELLPVLSRRLGVPVVPMATATGLGRATARAEAIEPARHRELLLDLLSTIDDGLLHSYLERPERVTLNRLVALVGRHTHAGGLSPVYFGSARTGAGMDLLRDGIVRMLPAGADPHGVPAGSVFKVDRGAAGEKISYVRMYRGRLRLRERPQLGGLAGPDRITAIEVVEPGGATAAEQVIGGQIARLWGLKRARIGDVVGVADGSGRQAVRFAPPSLETVVVPRDPGNRGRLYTALSQLAEQDPLIGVHRDEATGEIAVSLFGEVQKEVLQATLQSEFSVAVTMQRSTTICAERPVGTGAAVEYIGTEENPFLATVGLRVDPLPPGTGIRYQLEVELGSMPYALMRAIEETVHSTLIQGLHGWQVLDCAVTLTHTGYWARQSHAHATFDKSMSSTAGDFRGLTPLVLINALQAAGTTVYEPVHGFLAEIPPQSYSSVITFLTKLGAVPRQPEVQEDSYLVTGTIPAAHVHEVQQRLADLTAGSGVFESSFETYQPVHGPIPSRPRRTADPLDRRTYLLQVLRRV